MLSLEHVNKKLGEEAGPPPILDMECGVPSSSLISCAMTPL